MKLIATAIATLFLLSACATPPYTLPAGKPVARLRVVVPHAAYHVAVLASGRPSGTCEGEVADLGKIGGGFAFLNPTDITPLGMPSAMALTPGTFIERQIPADGRYLLTARLFKIGVCRMAASFHPMPNVDYEAGVGSDGRTCRLFLRRLDVDGAGKVVATEEKSVVAEDVCAKDKL